MPRTTQSPLQKKFKNKEKIIRELSDPKQQASHPKKSLSVLNALLDKFNPGRLKTELYRQSARCASYLPQTEQLGMYATGFVTANLQQAMTDALDPQLQNTNPRYCAVLCKTILNHVDSKEQKIIWQQYSNHLDMLMAIKSHYRHPIDICSSLVSSMLRFLITNPEHKTATLLQLKTFEHNLAPISISYVQNELDELKQLSSAHTAEPELEELISLIHSWSKPCHPTQCENTQPFRDTAKAAIKAINQNMHGTHPLSHQETLNYGNIFMHIAQQSTPIASRATWYQYAAYCFALAMNKDATAYGIKRFIECATDKEKNTAYGQLITQEISRNSMYNIMMTTALESCLYANKQPFKKLVGCFTLASSQFSFFSDHAEQSVIDVTHQTLKK